MGDVAALSLSIESSSVVKAANDLDKFAAASDRAKVAAGSQSSGIAKLVALAQSMDSKLSALVGSLDKIAGATKAAAAANDNMAVSAAKAGAALSVADSHVIAYTQHLAGLAAAQRDANSHVLAYQRHLASLPAALNNAAKSGAALQANTGNIAAQFQDIGVTAAMGMNPLLIALQQGTQLSAVFAQSGGSMRDVLVGAFKQVASAQAIMTIGIVAAAAALIQLASSYFTASDAAKAQQKAADELVKSIAALDDAVRKETSSQAQNTAERLKNAFMMRQQTAETLKLAQAELSRQKIFLAGADDQQSNAFSSAQYVEAEGRRNNAIASMDAQLAQVKKLQAEINRSDASIRGLQAIAVSARGATYFDKGADAARRFDTALGQLTARYRDGKIGIEQYASESAKLRGGLHTEQEAIKAANASHRTRKSGLSDEAKAARDAAKAYEQLAMRMADIQTGANANVWKLAQDAGKAQQSWTDAEFAERNPLDLGKYDVKAMEAADRARQMQLDTEYRLLGVYLDQLDAIRQMGGAFDTIGGIVQGIASGNFRSVGGKMGGLLGTIGGMDTGVFAESKYGAAGDELEKPERIGSTIADHLTKVFRENGEFFSGLKTVLANAAIGSTAAGLTGGSKLGGALGGAVGGKLGEKMLGGVLSKVSESLGSFAGPLGSMLGGVIGGALGGMLKKAKYGTATIGMDQYGQLNSSVTSGRGAQQMAAANSAAGGVITGIESIANQLGATISNIPNITIGTYKDAYRVSTAGRTGKLKGKYSDVTDFGKDGEQAAIAFAVQKAIERGVITGISQASINILKSGQDLQKAIEKATLIESIPKELQKLTDPVGYAVNEVNDKFVKIVAALREGGASAEQMAQAQQLYNLQMADAKGSANAASQALKDFLKSMNVGSTSPLSLRSQAATAQSMIDPYLAQINAGQAINQDKYLDAAQTYLDVQRQLYGSTAKYFEAFDMIQAATNKAIGTADSNVSPIRTTSDPFIEQTANSTKALAANSENQVMLMQQSVALQQENNELIKKLMASGFIGTTRNYA